MRVCAFLEAFLKHPKGIKAGQPFIPADWQRQGILEPLYDTVGTDRLRRYRQGLISVARKNGKTALAAALSLYHLVADNEFGAECYAAAASRDQASLLFDAAAAMVEMSPTLHSRLQVTRHTKTIRDPVTNSVFRALSADAPTQHGLNSSFIVLDEIAMQADRTLFDVLSTSMGARRAPLMLAIGTAGTNPHSLAHELYQHSKQLLSGAVKDDAFFAYIREVPVDANWQDESLWKLSNPAVDDFRSRQELQEACARARLIPAQETAFRNLFLNQWTKSESRWIPLEHWDACPRIDIDLKGRLCYGAFDLGFTRDLSAMALAFPIDGAIALLLKYWMPAEGIEERSRRDRVPYSEWVKRGLIEVTEGSDTEYAAIEKGILEARDLYDMRVMAFDPWAARQLSQRLQMAGVPVAEFRQTAAMFSAPTRDFEARVLAHTFKHEHDPVTRWMLDCVTIKTDCNGNARPIKPPRLEDSRRIDGAVAAIMSIGQITSEPDISAFLADPLIIDVNGPAEKRAANPRNN